jgi:uncharacterized protein
MNDDINEDLIGTFFNDTNKKQDAKNVSNHIMHNVSKLGIAEEVDKISNQINDDFVQKIDCLKCGNCCKTTVTTFNESDVSRASKFLQISKKNFVNKYLIDDMGEYTTITTPCPFLQEDNKCKIYEVRPEACASFPHTQKKGFAARRAVHAANYTVCPITYHVVNELMKLK